MARSGGFLNSAAHRQASQSPARVGRNIDGGSQKTAAHPGLPGFRKAVAAEVRDAQPSFLLDFRGQFLKRFPCTNRHGVILGGDQVDVGSP